jgi:hypothetical protein
MSGAMAVSAVPASSAVLARRRESADRPGFPAATGKQVLAVLGLAGTDDAVGQEAVPATRVEIGEQHGNGLPDNPAAVGGGAVTQQGEPGAFEVKQFLSGQVHGDLLSVLLTTTGPAMVAIIRARRRRPQ